MKQKKYYYFVIFIFLIISCNVNKDYSNIKKELIEVLEKDQSNRLNGNWLEQKIKDEENLIVVTKILDSLGWLGTKEIGSDANAALFLVIQHSNLKTMEKYLPMLQNAVIKNNATKEELALLTDRIEVLNKRPQIYGTQGTDINGVFILDSIIDKKNVNKRRAEMGMQTLEEYLLILKKIYKLKYKKHTQH
jgi:hypothetical protein